MADTQRLGSRSRRLLAVMSGCDPKTIERIERGDVVTPATATRVQQAAKRLDIQIPKPVIRRVWGRQRYIP